MKKVLSLVLLVLILLVVVGCDKQNDNNNHDNKELTYKVVKEETFEIGKIRKTSSPKSTLYYKEVASNQYEIMVASNLEYEIGDTITVLTIDLSYGYSYNVIKLNDNDLDTSFHTYIENLGV